MAKSVGSWKIVIKGSGDTVAGAEVSMGYSTASSVDADHESKTKSHLIPEPSFSKTVTDFVSDEIALIKSSEGIS